MEQVNQCRKINKAKAVQEKKDGRKANRAPTWMKAKNKKGPVLNE